MHARIICIGNRFLAVDAAGPMVHDLIARMPLPKAVELIDGGTGGLRLLPLLEHCDLVLFVDAVNGFLADPGVIILDPTDLEIQAPDCGHCAGLAMLLGAAPYVLDTPIPEILIIGIEGQADETTCNHAAVTCLTLIEERASGKHRRQPVIIQEAVDERPGN